MLFLRWAFAAIRAGVSVMPFANGNRVAGAGKTRGYQQTAGTDRLFFGYGRHHGADTRDDIFQKHFHTAKRLSMVPEASEKIVWTELLRLQDFGFLQMLFAI